MIGTAGATLFDLMTVAATGTDIMALICTLAIPGSGNRVTYLAETYRAYVLGDRILINITAIGSGENFRGEKFYVTIITGDPVFYLHLDRGAVKNHKSTVSGTAVQITFDGNFKAAATQLGNQNNL